MLKTHSLGSGTGSFSLPIVCNLLAHVCLLFYSGDCLKVANLDLPEYALVGESFDLTCLYSLQNENRPISNNVSHLINQQQELTASNDEIDVEKREQIERLYAIKWYKDGSEFYRYLAHDYPRRLSLPVDGITVNLDQSNNRTVRLQDVSLKTSGLFKCEVSLDAPHFLTKSKQRNMHVFLLPNSGPAIEFANMSSKPANCHSSSPQTTSGCHVMKPALSTQVFAFESGDQIQLECKAPESKPMAQLDWIINGWLNLTSWPNRNLPPPPLQQQANPNVPRDASVAPETEDFQSPFSVSKRYFVKIPTPSTFATPAAAPISTKPQQSSLVLSNTINENLHEIVNSGQQSDFRSIANKDKVWIQPTNEAAGAVSGMPRPISSSLLLDQHPVIGTSGLSFKIDENLVKSLVNANAARKSGLLMGGQKSISKRALYNLIGSPSSKQHKHSLSVTTNHKLGWVIQNTGLNRANFNDQIMHISCVSRVLHVKLSANIRITVSSQNQKNNSMHRPHSQHSQQQYYNDMITISYPTRTFSKNNNISNFDTNRTIEIIITLVNTIFVIQLIRHS